MIVTYWIRRVSRAALVSLLCFIFLQFTACFFPPQISLEQENARKLRVESLLRQGVLLLRENTSVAIRLARSSFLAVREIMPQDPRGYDGLGCVHLRFGELEKARLYFQEARKQDRSYQPAYLHLAFLDELEGHLVSANENYKIALLLSPLSHRARLNYGIFLRDARSPFAKAELLKFMMIESAAKSR